jgi:hypothetical protein
MVGDLDSDGWGGRRTLICRPERESRPKHWARAAVAALKKVAHGNHLSVRCFMRYDRSAVALLSITSTMACGRTMYAHTREIQSKVLSEFAAGTYNSRQILTSASVFEALSYRISTHDCADGKVQPPLSRLGINGI